MKKVVSIFMVIAILFTFAACGTEKKDTEPTKNDMIVDDKLNVNANIPVVDAKYEFTVAEFNYYYYNTWYNYQNTAYQFEVYYGEGMGLKATGYDYTKAPSEQEYTDDAASITGITLKDLGNPSKPTWADALTYVAINNIIQIKYGVTKAKEMGLALTEAQELEISKSIENAHDTAKENGTTIDKWFQTQYGKGVSEKLVRQIAFETQLATAYYEKLEYDIAGEITEEEIIEEYNKNPDLYGDSLSLMSDVRHILVMCDEMTNETEVEKCRAKAQSILEEYNKNKTEENFIVLTKKYTDDVDSKGNPNNDGLYENVANDGKYVKAFEKWATDSSRKPGDTGIIQTEYGFHIMYYVEGTETWYLNVKNAILEEKYGKLTDDVFAEIMKKVDFKNKTLKQAKRAQNEFIAENIANNE